MILQARKKYRAIVTEGKQSSVIEEIVPPDGVDFRFVVAVQAAGGDLLYETGMATYIWYTGKVKLKVYLIPMKKEMQKYASIQPGYGESTKELGSVCCMIIPLSSPYTPQKQVLPTNIFTGCMSGISGMCGAP